MFYYQPGLGGTDAACAFLGFRIINVPIAVSAAYFPIFFIASFLLISSVPLGVFSVFFDSGMHKPTLPVFFDAEMHKPTFPGVFFVFVILQGSWDPP